MAPAQTILSMRNVMDEAQRMMTMASRQFVAERTMSLDEIVDDLSMLLTGIDITYDGNRLL